MAEEPIGRPRKHAKARDREMQVIEMRRSRLDWDTIAMRCDPPYKTGDVARHVWNRAVKRRTADTIDEERDLAKQTMEGVIQTFYPKARRGDEKAAEILIKAVKQHAKYFPGLEAPTEIQHEIKPPPTADEVEAFLQGAHEQWLASTGKQKEIEA